MCRQTEGRTIAYHQSMRQQRLAEPGPVAYLHQHEVGGGRLDSKAQPGETLGQHCAGVLHDSAGAGHVCLSLGFERREVLGYWTVIVPCMPSWS